MLQAENIKRFKCHCWRQIPDIYIVTDVRARRISVSWIDAEQFDTDISRHRSVLCKGELLCNQCVI